MFVAGTRQIFWRVLESIWRVPKLDSEQPNYAFRRDELVKAIMKSDRTYEEVLAFLGAGDAEEEA